MCNSHGTSHHFVYACALCEQIYFFRNKTLSFHIAVTQINRRLNIILIAKWIKIWMFPLISHVNYKHKVKLRMESHFSDEIFFFFHLFKSGRIWQAVILQLCIKFVYRLIRDHHKWHAHEIKMSSSCPHSTFILVYLSRPFCEFDMSAFW